MAIESVKHAVGAVIERAAQATGVDFGFLMRTAGRESGLDTAAKAPTSSAAGLFQFVEQSWLGVLKRHGARHGYAGYADLIRPEGDGRLSVSGADARKAVLGLRLDARAASLMAGELASENSAYLRGRVGREPTSGELYAAHFLGAKGSADLIEARQLRPAAAAAALFPEAAAANPSIFHPGGRPASVAEVYASLTQGQDGAQGAAVMPDQEFVHSGTRARLARMEQEREMADLILGLNTGMGKGDGDFMGSTQGQGPAGSMFTTELLSLLSQDRKVTGSGGGYG